MAKNADGSVTLKTTGKTASNPGRGAPGRTPPVAAGVGSGAGPKLVRTKGRGPVPRNTANK